MKMPGGYEEYEKIRDKNKDEFLKEILRAESESRNNSTMVKRIKKANFPTLKRFEERMFTRRCTGLTDLHSPLRILKLSISMESSSLHVGYNIVRGAYV